MSRWSPQDAPDLPGGLILFDGVCVFCSRWVRFVMDRDAQGLFRFQPIQGEGGRALAARFGIAPDAPETNAVVLDGRAWFKSDAALAVLGRLPDWRWTGALRAIPKPVRDTAYDLIATNRYRIFGRTDQCMIPPPEARTRFLP